MLSTHEHLFSCPHCGEHMTVSATSGLACSGGHSYNIARQGYVNTVTRPVKNEYSRELFLSRKKMIESGLFDPLLEHLATYLETPSSPCYLLDAGCGEGTPLARLAKGISPLYQTVGMDISKEGIRLAAANYKNSVWVVGDLAHVPLVSQRIDVIFNLLSPANYEEFHRLLTPEGMVLKVVPNSSYLKEIRTLFYGKNLKEYHNNEVTALFQSAFPVVTSTSLTYSFVIPPERLSDMLTMTPLTWKIPPEDLERVKRDLSEVTMDFTILVGRNK